MILVVRTILMLVKMKKVVTQKQRDSSYYLHIDSDILEAVIQIIGDVLSRTGLEKLKQLFRKYRSSRPKLFLGKYVLKIYSKFTGEHPCQSMISKKLQSNFVEITLSHGCFPVNLLHIFRTPLKISLDGCF